MRKLLVVPLTAVAMAAMVVPAGSATSISVRDNSFSPRSVTVSKGATVKFVWRGRASHNVRGGALNSPIKRSGTYSKKISRTTNYVCTLHRGMSGTIRVR